MATQESVRTVNSVGFIPLMSRIRYFDFSGQRDIILLVARLGLMVLFILYGYTYITDFQSLMTYLAKVNAPAPVFIGIVACIVEFFCGLAVVFGFYTRPLAMMFAFYTMATAFVGHRYWDMTGADIHANYVHFFKNVSITGGFLALCISGPGLYSIDRR